MSAVRILFDGPSGVNGLYWNTHLAVPWDHVLGDWRDADGLQQGPKAYASMPVLTTGAVLFEITALVREWLANGNTGAMITCPTPTNGTVIFDSREAGASGPRLDVLTDSGNVVCPCTADSTLHPSKKHYGADRILQVAGNTSRAAVQFDLSGVRGRVTSAVLTLTASKVADTNRRIEIMLLDPPPIWTDAPAPLVESGLSAAYPADRGIESAPGVYFASDFSPGWDRRFTTQNAVGKLTGTGYEQPAFLEQNHLSWGAALPEYVAVPEIGGRYVVRWQYPIRPPALGGVAGLVAYYEFWKAGKNDPDELFVRATARHDTSAAQPWGSSNDGQKHLACVFAQYGWRDYTAKPPYDYWHPVNGNGGSPCRGVFVPAEASVAIAAKAGATSIVIGGLPRSTRFMLSGGGLFRVGGKDYQCVSSSALATDASGNLAVPVFTPPLAADVAAGAVVTGSWSSTAFPVDPIAKARGHYSGWTVRGLTPPDAGSTRANDGNPYGELVGLSLYIYHMGQAGPYGDTVRLGSRAVGYPCIAPGRFISMELRVKLNSLTGTPDAFGNLLAVRDGRVTAWFEGVKVFDQGGYAFRAHPAMKIQSAALDEYHGGTTAPVDVFFTSTGPTVAASQYIGPFVPAPAGPGGGNGGGPTSPPDNPPPNDPPPPAGDPPMTLDVTKTAATSPLPPAVAGAPLVVYLHGSTSESNPEGTFGDLYNGTTTDPALGIMPLIWRVRGEGTSTNRYAILRMRESVLRPSDNRKVETHWCGYMADGSSPVVPYTERRLAAVIADTLARYPNLDPQAVIARGNSMGGWGCGTFGLRHPEIFAAIVTAQPRWRAKYPVNLAVGYEDTAHPNPPFDDVGGMVAFQTRQDMIAYVSNPANEIPFLAWSIGTQDVYGPWAQQQEMIAALRATGRGFAVAWFNSPHAQTVEDQGNVALASYLPWPASMFRQGRGYPVLSASSLDTPLTAPAGGINLGYSWTIVTETADSFVVDLKNASGDFTVTLVPHSSVYAGDRTPQTVSGLKNEVVRVSFAGPVTPPPPPPPKLSERVQSVADAARAGSVTLLAAADLLDGIADDLRAEDE